MGIFSTSNSRNFCVYWSIDLKLAEILQNGVIYTVLKFCPKNRQLKFLMTSLQTMNSMSIIEKVFHYEENEISVIKCRDDIWFKAKQVAILLGNLDPGRSIR